MGLLQLLWGETLSCLNSLDIRVILDGPGVATQRNYLPNCQTLEIVQQQDLMDKINNKLSSNLKNLKGANVEDDDDKSLSREKLIKEIKQYEKVPNDYRHCIISPHLYM
jgi:hypothetical protein